uniref:MARVEL domain-containing protein n=1 Tax=Arion vulgaris TaxID=1028688 RepID=A0A0B7AA98_9EUPU
MVIAPVWFFLIFSPTDGTFGSQPVVRELSIESGLFFLKATEFDNWIFTDTFTGRDAVPKQIQTAQFFSVFASCILFACIPAGLLLICRRLASPTALLILAAAVTLGALSEVLVIIFCGDVFRRSSCDPYGSSNCKYEDNLVWRMVPIYTQLYRNEPNTTPYVQPQWAFFIAIIGALITIAAAVMFWIEALRTCRTVEKIRYQQLRQSRDPFENEFDPYAGKKYRYLPPSQQGPNSYGMQPVFHSVRYDGTVLAPPPSFDNSYTAPAMFVHPSSRYEGRGGPPSTISSTSGPIVSREIDL